MSVESTGIFGFPTGTTTPATTPATAQSKNKPVESAGMATKDEFLQLLVAQLKNQDPLDPVKNENFLAQLATFSSLEQLVAIKEGIDKLVGTSTDGTTDTTATSNQS